MDNYKEFLKQVSGKKDCVDQQLSKSTVKYVDKNRKVLLFITDAIKTIIRMGVLMRGYRVHSRYQPDVVEPAIIQGLAISLNSSILQFDRETKLWGII